MFKISHLLVIIEIQSKCIGEGVGGGWAGGGGGGEFDDICVILFVKKWYRLMSARIQLYICSSIRGISQRHQAISLFTKEDYNHSLSTPLPPPSSDPL